MFTETSWLETSSTNAKPLPTIFSSISSTVCSSWKDISDIEQLQDQAVQFIAGIKERDGVVDAKTKIGLIPLHKKKRPAVDGNMLSQNTPDTGRFGTEMLLWCLGYYTDINSQIEKLVAQCIGNIWKHILKNSSSFNKNKIICDQIIEKCPTLPRLP